MSLSLSDAMSSGVRAWGSGQLVVDRSSARGAAEGQLDKSSAVPAAPQPAAEVVVVGGGGESDNGCGCGEGSRSGAAASGRLLDIEDLSTPHQAAAGGGGQRS